MLRSVTKLQVLDRMRFENPWWVSGQIDPYYKEKPARMYFQQFKTLANEITVQRALVLMGPRRIGKTVMLHHWVQDLMDQKVSPRKIVFITIENPIYNNIGLEQLFSNAREASGDADNLDGWYVIFDEIQYLKDWDIHLKSLVESYRNTKFVVSGSAAAALKYKSNDIQNYNQQK